MRRGSAVSYYTVALALLCAGPSAQGERIIHVLSDWGTAFAEGKILDRWTSAYQGPLLSFNGITIDQVADLQPGGLHSVLAQTLPGTGTTGWTQLTTKVQVASETFTSYGRAEAHFNVNFVVPDEAVPFIAHANLDGGILDYNLFDVTSNAAIVDWHIGGTGELYTSVDLLPGHEYWLSLNSRAEAQGTAALKAQASYDFDAVITPEPSTMLLIATGLIHTLRPRRRGPLGEA